MNIRYLCIEFSHKTLILFHFHNFTDYILILFLAQNNAFLSLIAHKISFTIPSNTILAIYLHFLVFKPRKYENK